MDELALISKGREQWGAEEFQAEAPVGSRRLFYIALCVCLYVYHIYFIHTLYYICAYILMLSSICC